MYFFCVVRIVEGEGPCIIMIMSSGKTAILTFGALESSADRSLIIMVELSPRNPPRRNSLHTTVITFALEMLNILTRARNSTQHPID